MGKRHQFDEDGTAVAVKNSKKEEPEDVKDYRLRKHGVNMKNRESKMKQHFFMSYNECLSLINNPDSGLGGAVIKYKFVRHMSLPYHLNSKAAMQDAIDFVGNSTVGKYKEECKGIVVAVGAAKIVSPPRVIGDQYTFHLDVLVPQIVFVPKRGHKYEAKVRRVDVGVIYAVVFGMITIHLKQNDKATGDEVGFDDKILVEYTGIRIKDSLCHLQGNYVKLIEKAPPIKNEKENTRKEFGDDDGQEEGEENEETRSEVKPEVKSEEDDDDGEE